MYGSFGIAVRPFANTDNDSFTCLQRNCWQYNGSRRDNASHEPTSRNTVHFNLQSSEPSDGPERSTARSSGAFCL
jgi:hypothetical protein